MRTRFAIYSGLCFLLLFVVVLFAGRLTSRTGIRLDLAAGDIGTLAPATIRHLRDLDHNLDFTFFVSSRRQMPSHLQQVGPGVRRLLEAMRQIDPDRIDVRIIDPAVSGAATASYAARRKVSPVKVSRVVRDRHDQQEIWSSLVIAREGQKDLLIQDVEDADLPYIEELILGQLTTGTRPRPARFAVAAPPGFSLLPQALEEYGSVEIVDLHNAVAIPNEADILFWMQPLVVTPEHVRALAAFRRQGRAVVLAGSAYSVRYDLSGDQHRYHARTLPDGWARLLRTLGLLVQPDLLLDRNSGPVFLGHEDGSTRQVQAPFNLRCLPAFYDMKSFLGPARGGLSFLSASPLEGDPRRLAATGDRVEIVGTTTEHAWVQALPTAPFGDADLAPDLVVGKQNLMLLLKPEDPWHGPVVVLASASPFQDGILNQPGYAHGLFLRTLVRTFTAPERLVRNDIDRSEHATLPPTTSATRLLWRLFTTALIPLAVLVWGVGLYRARALRWLRTLGERRGGSPPFARAALVVLAIPVVLVVAAQLWAAVDDVAYDATATGIHTLAPTTVDAFARALDRQGDPLRADLVISGQSRMPTAMKGVEPRIAALMKQAGIELSRLRPEHLEERERQQLRATGLAPFELRRVVRDTLVDQAVWSSLRLLRGDAVVVVPRLDAHAMDHLEFLVVAALERLDRGRPLHVAVVSDLPRLSPAEALEDYQKKGLMAPGGADVYSNLKALLSDYGYRVTHVSLRDPFMPKNVDLVLWLQPRRDSSRIILLLSEHLRRGGSAIVAMQHFNIQQRQYRGTGFETVYWPQPQFQDFDQYLRLLGVEQVREVLMDRTRSHLVLDTQVNRTAVREYDPQKVALPFLLRTVSANYADDSPVTRNLGDLLFIWGNRFTHNDDLLQRNGLERKLLIGTTSQAWNYAWTGGWLSPEVFEPQQFLPGPQPLALELNGRFPGVEFVEDEDGREQLTRRTVEEATPAGLGRLLLIGGSEMFKNGHLHRQRFDHAQLILNAVARYAYGDELAKLQARRATVPGFEYRDPETVAAWRIFAIGAGPLVVLGFGLWRLSQWRTPLRTRA